MKIAFPIILVICFSLFYGCGTVKPVFHKGDNRKNYENIFEEKLPSDVDVVNSVYVTYSGYRPGTNTTPDWEIELIAPRKWIESKIENLRLKQATEPESRGLKAINFRLKNTRDWYAPKSISSYDCYYLYPTSIPYIHMLVEKKPLKDRYKVFLSKH